MMCPNGCKSYRHEGPCPDTVCQGCGWPLEEQTEDMLCEPCRLEIGHFFPTEGYSVPEYDEVNNERPY
jgi:hypothetical protein